LEVLARSRLRGAPPPAAVLAAYAAVFETLRGRLAALIGPLGVRAVFGRAVQLAAREQPLAGTIRVGPEGLDLAALAGAAPAPTVAALEAALGALARALLTVLQGLIGPGLVTGLLTEVEHALAGAPAPAIPDADGLAATPSPVKEEEPDDEQ
jgi:hypothetical protein